LHSDHAKNEEETEERSSGKSVPGKDRRKTKDASTRSRGGQNTRTRGKTADKKKKIRDRNLPGRKRVTSTEDPVEASIKTLRRGKTRPSRGHPLGKSRIRCADGMGRKYGRAVISPDGRRGDGSLHEETRRK